MQQAKTDFSVKFVGTYSTPEIKKQFPHIPQKPFHVYYLSNSMTKSEALACWDQLPESSKEPFVNISKKQKELSSEIKALIKKKFSLTQALAEVNQNIAALKENYKGLRVVKQFVKTGRKNLGFERFSEDWLAKNTENQQKVGQEMRNIACTTRCNVAMDLKLCTA